MKDNDSLLTVMSELETGMDLKKCRHYSCMCGAFEDMCSTLLALRDETSSPLLDKVEFLLTKTEETAYS